jgi:hypothetical protein
MDVYYGTVQSAVVHTLTRPPLVKTHTSNPAFPTGCWLGGFVFVACGGVGRRGHPFSGGWSHSPPVGKGGDVDDGVLCVGGGCGGGLALVGVLGTGLFWWGGRRFFSVLGGGCLMRVGGCSGGITDSR